MHAFHCSFIAMSPTRPERISDEVKHSIVMLREFYRHGKRAPVGRNHGQNKIAAAAEKIGVNEDTLRKARVFANPEVGYTRVELNELIDQLKSHTYSGKRWRFGRTHMIRLISVRDRAGRKSLQDEVIDRELTCSQLDRVIRQRYGSRKRAGRHRFLPRERAELLSEIDHECDSWHRWWQTLTRIEEGTTRLAQLPKAVQTKLRETAAGIEKLQKSAQRAAARQQEPE